MAPQSAPTHGETRPSDPNIDLQPELSAMSAAAPTTVAQPEKLAQVQPMAWPSALPTDRYSEARPTNQTATSLSKLMPDAVVRALPTAAKEGGQIAFAARLIPVTTAKSATSAIRPLPTRAATTLVTPSRVEAPSPQPQPEPEHKSESSDKSRPGKPAPHNAPPSTGAPQERPADSPHREATVRQEPIPPATQAAATTTPQEKPRESAAEPQPPTTRSAEPESPKQPAATPAREIRLEVAGGERKVEIKLSDRAGELKVAVRTPDSHLAERLRENLPALSSRLEENGLRAETWRPTSTSGDWRNPGEVSTTSQSGHPDTPSGQQGREQHQQDQQSRHQRAQEDDQQTLEKGKKFQWFLSATQ